MALSLRAKPNIPNYTFSFVVLIKRLFWRNLGKAFFIENSTADLKLLKCFFLKKSYKGWLFNQL